VQQQQQEDLKLEEELKKTMAIGRQIKGFHEQSPGAAFRSMPVEKCRTRSPDEDISIAKNPLPPLDAAALYHLYLQQKAQTPEVPLVNSEDKVAMLEAQVKSLTAENEKIKEKSGTFETFYLGHSGFD
jgi:hypothetical protein